MKISLTTIISIKGCYHLELYEFFLKHIMECLLTLAVSILSYVCHYLKKKLDEEKVVREALKELLRIQLFNIHAHYVRNRGNIPIYGKENATAIYNAYHALKGNGVGTNLYNEIMDLPTNSDRSEEVQ